MTRVLARLLLLPALAAALASPLAAAQRFPDIPPDRMTPEQKAIFDAIQNGPRKNAQGPFQAWLRSPDLADRLQKVGEYVRFRSSLPPRLSEFAILLAGRYWDSPFEWDYHYPLAIKGGVSAEVLAAVAQGREPTGMKDDEAVLYQVTQELRRTRKLSDPTYAKAMATFGERGIVDILTVAGYYDIVCMTLNVAEVPGIKDTQAPPLAPMN